ncbi:hypothetical protein GCM10011507_04070 [Edaphobacter acidisoli]|uniref:DUF2059 domain-containing protein n=2 Tax=Edaphobacter acidisoli TaxID=2040573 RepID=A0A916RGP1_9BACT|nr:DUF2059 domain-containing protein [Edaphobacter acidisoli]GGA55952.1 hypothetical protein GCM10011507_04070 [Edaphobacter acidisoli]
MSRFIFKTDFPIRPTQRTLTSEATHMTTKLLLACTLLCATLHAQTQQTQPAPTTPAHPATVEQIHQYYAITHSIETAHKVMDQMVTAMQSTAPSYLPQNFWDDLRQSINAVDLEGAFIPAYQKYFSEEDMNAVLGFYKSPAGQHMLEAQPLISSYAQQELREIGQKIGQEVYLRHKDEIEAARNKYEESQHPEATPDTTPAPTPPTQKQ